VRGRVRHGRGGRALRAGAMNPNEPLAQPSEIPGVLPGTPTGEPERGPGIEPGTPAEKKQEDTEE